MKRLNVTLVKFPEPGTASDGLSPLPRSGILTWGPALDPLDQLRRARVEVQVTGHRTLLLNARDAMPRGGTVSVETARGADRPGWLQLTVADAGHGMTPDALRRLFESFYTTETSGIGLGLSVTPADHPGARGKRRRAL